MTDDPQLSSNSSNLKKRKAEDPPEERPPAKFVAPAALDGTGRVNLAVSLLREQYPNEPFAFILDPDSFTIHYAVGDDPYYPCLALLVQGAMTAAQADNARIHHTPNVVHNPLTNGIIKFCCKLKLQALKPLNHSPQALTGFLRSAKVAQTARRIRLSEVRRDSVARRAPLDIFTLNGLGALPQNIDLAVNAGTKGEGFNTVHRLYMMAAFVLARRTNRRYSNNATAGGKTIGAILATGDGQVRAWGVNTNYVNYAQHAEVNTIQSFLKQGNVINPNTTYYLYTTLKPCCMCAGMIRQCFGNNVRVYFGMDDPGGHIDNTLDGQQFALSAPPAQINAPVQAQLKPITFAVDKSKITVRQGVMDTATPASSGFETRELGHRVGDMTQTMNFCFQNRPVYGDFLLRFLHQATGIYLMRCADERFSAKYREYQALTQAGRDKRRNVRVLQVLRYLFPFVTARTR